MEGCQSILRIKHLSLKYCFKSQGGVGRVNIGARAPSNKTRTLGLFHGVEDLCLFTSLFFTMASPTLITIIQGKGGVGKTTITHALAWQAVKCGKRVLVVDADSQMNLTQLLLQPHLPADYGEDYLKFINDRGLTSLAATMELFRHGPQPNLTQVNLLLLPFYSILFPCILRKKYFRHYLKLLLDSFIS